MSQLDALLERSRSPGTFVTRKHFTLARHKAIEKMREFSLRHPRQYVLELIQAAVFAEATWIAIDVREDSLLAGWVGGKRLTEAQLGSLFDYLFIDQVDLERRHLMQLAVGLNAIYQRKPKVVRIESGDGSIEGTTRMELASDGTIRVGQPQEGLGGTYLYAEFDAGWWSRFFPSTGTTAEARLVEERCLYTPVPILLNGSAPFGYRAQREIQLFGVRQVVNVLAGSRRGTLGRARRSVRPEVRFVVGGVWITTAEIEAFGPGIAGVIADDELRKTADMSDIVRDERWLRMLHAVQPFATKLIRREEASYRPPKLPPKPDLRTTASAAPGTRAAAVVAVPIEGPIEGLGVRPVLRLAQVQSLPPGTPVFWVSEEASGELEDAGDPANFPFHVLVLDEGRATWLAEHAPSIALSPLTSAADFRFVHRILQRRSEHREATLDVPIGGQQARLTLRLHLEGRTPDWGVGEGVPALIRQDGRSVRTERLPLDLEQISVAIDLAGELDSVELSAELVRKTLLHAWRLIDLDAVTPATTTLIRTLLPLHARPTFVERDGQRTLDAILPADWGPVGERLRNAPLAETLEGPLTLNNLLQLIQEGRTATLTNPETFDELASLELVFGPGHLIHAERQTFPILGLGRWGTRWVLMTTPLSTSRPEVAIGLRDQLAEGPMDGWTLHTRLGSVEVWVREGQEAGDVATGLQDFAGRLARELGQGPRSDALLTPRARAMARLGLIHLSAHTGAPIELPSTSGELRDLGQASLAFVPLHGAQIAERDTIAVSFDELRALEVLQPGRTLRFDDQAEVWQDLAHGNEGWLLRQEVRVPGIEGWVGLRSPIDLTGGVLLETSRDLVAIGSVDRDIPCHGLLWAHSTVAELKPSQVELVRLAAVQLYQSLLEIIDGDLSGDDRVAADHYAAIFALRTASMRASLPAGTARELAARVRIRGLDGSVWGSLERWLDADPRLRPPLPKAWQPYFTSAEQPDVDALHHTTTLPERLATRLQDAIVAIIDEAQVQARLVSSAVEGSVHVTAAYGLSGPSAAGKPTVQITVLLNATSPAVMLAEKEWRLFEMLLLEATRQVALLRDDQLTFPELARAIVAQRLGA